MIISVLKSTGSAFEGFIRDEYTTLKGASHYMLLTRAFLSYPPSRRLAKRIRTIRVVHWPDLLLTELIVEQKSMTESSRRRSI